MEKLRFDFEVKPSADGKSNIICITSIATTTGQIFRIPIEFQPANLHPEITNTPNYGKVKKSLSKRHQTRRVWIALTDVISKIYLDDEGNVQFNDIYLEELQEKKEAELTPAAGADQTLSKLLEKLLEQKGKTLDLGKIAKEFVIDRFTGKNSNACQWMKDFNKECDRFQLVDDKEKIEILKNFLDCPGMDWYSCMLIKNTVESDWNKWEKSFCETFANKGWSPSRYALAFRYRQGSLLDYALKKEKLLLEVRKSIDTGSLIDLIAFGLPNYVTDKIDREVLRSTEDLYNEIGKLEHLVAKNKDESKYIKSESKIKKYEEKQPCQICVKERKGKRFHSEESCWFKENRPRTGVRTVNNSELEVELNEKNPKN